MTDNFLCNDTFLIMINFVDGYNKIKLMRVNRLFYKYLRLDQHKLAIENCAKPNAIKHIMIPSIATNMFTNAITKHNLIAAKWISDIMRIDLSTLQYAFEITCVTYGHADIPKWLFKLNNRIVVSSAIFHDICKAGFFELAKWIYDGIKCADRKANITRSAMLATRNIDIAKFFYETKLVNPTDFNFLISIASICQTASVDLLKWYFSIGVDFKNPACENCFVKACTYNYDLEAVQFLYVHSKGNNNRTQLNNLFAHTCMHGYLHVAQWIYSLDNIRHKVRDSFWALTRKSDFNCEMADWLYSIDPLFDTYVSKLVIAVILSRNKRYLEWIYSKNSEYLNKKRYFKMACRNSFDIAEWMESRIEYNVRYFVNGYFVNDTFIAKCSVPHYTLAWLYEISEKQ